MNNSIKLKIIRDESGFYLAKIPLHLLSPEMALKTEENLHTFVNEVFA